MLHGEPLTDNASLRDFNKGEGTYVADAVERSLLLPVDMEDLKNLQSKELFLSIKRYLSMVRSLVHSVFLVSISWFFTYALFTPNNRSFKLPIGWKKWPMTRVGHWTSSVKGVWTPRGSSRTPRPTS